MKTIFKIEDGREKFYQWDLNRRILVEDDSITQVHFANAATPTAYVVSVSAGTANVPNIILQQNFDIKVYGYDKEFTKFEKTFEVEKRSKPQDYVYTETEILNYETLANEIKEVKENIGASIQDYLKENPVSVDLSDYAKKKDIPSTAGLATEEYVNNKVQGLASTDYVDQAIAAVPQPDLRNYITNKEAEDKIKDFESFIMFRVRQEGYQTAEEVDSKISNAGLATEKYVNDAIAAIPAPDLSNYATKEEIPDVSAFQTAAQVNTAISNALNAIGVAEGRTY